MSSVWLATFLVINLSWCLATRASPAAWGRRLAGTLLWPRAPGQVPPLPTGSWLCQAVIIDPDTPSYPGTGPVCWSTWSLSEADWDSPHTPVLWWVLPGTVTADCISVYNGPPARWPSGCPVAALQPGLVTRDRRDSWLPCSQSQWQQTVCRHGGPVLWPWPCLEALSCGPVTGSRSCHHDSRDVIA